jgi:NADPH:quinone reductase-like Zn-dependent oxidoreductase
MVLADYWVAKPDPVDWADAAALPASGEAAVRVLGQLGVASGETLLLLGGTGSVGTIAAQLAIAHGVRVVAAVAAGDFRAAERLGAIPVEYGEALADSVRSAGGRVDAVMDAAGKGGLDTAIALAGGTRRVITLSDPDAAQLGVTLSGPVAEGIPQALREVMTELAAGLSLRPHTIVALAQAAEAHARLEQRELRSKVLLAT